MNVVNTVRGTDSDFFGVANLSDEPHHLWYKERMKLGEETVELLNTFPVFCLHDNKIKIDRDCLEEFKKRGETDGFEFLQKFFESLRKVGVEEVSANSVLDETPKIGKETYKNIGAIRMRDDRPVSGEFKLVKRRKTSDNVDIPEAPDFGSSSWKSSNRIEDRGALGTSVNRVLKPIQMFSVPAGFAAGDYVKVCDRKDMRMWPEHIEIPLDAYDGKQLNFEHPGERVWLLAQDGEKGFGFQAGGDLGCQHGARLLTHVKECRDKKCCVYGCGNEKAFRMLKDKVDKGTAKKYMMHWHQKRRDTMRRHGLDLRMYSSIRACNL